MKKFLVIFTLASILVVVFVDNAHASTKKEATKAMAAIDKDFAAMETASRNKDQLALVAACKYLLVDAKDVELNLTRPSSVSRKGWKTFRTSMDYLSQGAEACVAGNWGLAGSFFNKASAEASKAPNLFKED